MLPEKGGGGQAKVELPEVCVGREIQNTVPFLGRLFSLARAGINFV